MQCFFLTPCVRFCLFFLNFLLLLLLLLLPLLPPPPPACDLFRARALSLGSPPCTRLSTRTRSYLSVWRRRTFALHKATRPDSRIPGSVAP